MIRRPPRSTLSSSSAASDVYKRQGLCLALAVRPSWWCLVLGVAGSAAAMVVALRHGSSERSSPAWLLALPVCLATVFLVAGLAVGGSRLDSLGHSALEVYEGRNVTLSAVLTALTATASVT